MSKARSPREVCSITIGINGLISLLLLSLSRRPDVSHCFGLLLLGCPKLLACAREVDRDRLDLGDDTVERAAQQQVLAEELVAAVVPELRDDGLGVLLARLACLLADEVLQLVVGDL